MKITIEKMIRGSVISSFVALGLLISVQSTHAASMLFDDFEDTNLDGWAQANTGGSGLFEVVERNASNRAHIRHVSGTTTGDQSSLTQTFTYTTNDIVSFDMEALAFLSSASGRTRHGLAGVQVSFLNNFNVPLGSAGLFNVTSGSLLGPSDSSILSTQQSFSASMEDWAGLAGLDNSDPVAKMSLSFLARGSYSFGGNIYPNVRSGGDVWFDNVSVSQVPLPAAAWLFASAFGVFGYLGKRRASA